MDRPPKDVVGFRGERLVELRLTDHRHVGDTLFHPAFLGDKWPAIDLYVELLAVEGSRPYFFGQTKATSVELASGANHVRLAARRSDVLRLLQIPGPTYLFAVHEPTERVFVRSVHTGTPARSITRVSVANELTAANLVKLYNEVRRFWSAAHRKPDHSEFA